MRLNLEDMVIISPKTVTIITTYQCTAACTECCFECTPKNMHRLSLLEIINFIDSSIETYIDIELVVFTGGECFILKDDLFAAIEHCTKNGLKTRCVTNAYWAKKNDIAERYADRLLEVGIDEINISTGLDHQRWVTEKTVLQAVKALTGRGIFTLVTVEKDSSTSGCLDSIQSRQIIIDLMERPELFSLQSNAWMTFFESSLQREIVDKPVINKGCNQIFENIVITPKKQISACCGLTLEHIPEMKVGHMNDIGSYREQQKNDFLKLWIKVDGPLRIMELLLGEKHSEIGKINHQCEACALIHKDPVIIGLLNKKYHSFVPYVVNKYFLSTLKLSDK